jgi:hypothetical protein
MDDPGVPLFQETFIYEYINAYYQFCNVSFHVPLRLGFVSNI